MSKLKDMRIARGVTAKAVSEHLGVSRQTYATYEDNPKMMKVEQAESVCEFLHCNLSDIFLSA